MSDEETVTGVCSVSLGTSMVLVDWQVRVFGPSILVDRPSDHLYVRTITMSGCMGRRSHYKPSINHGLLLNSPDMSHEPGFPE